MANANKKKVGTGSHIRETRNQREEVPVQPGATHEGNGDDAMSPDQAMNEAQHRFGKTSRTVSSKPSTSSSENHTS